MPEFNPHLMTRDELVSLALDHARISAELAKANHRLADLQTRHWLKQEAIHSIRNALSQLELELELMKRGAAPPAK